MDAETILRIKPELTRFLHQFDDCFGRVSTRRYLDLYVEGQMSNLPRKSVEPIADAAGEPPRNLQQFLSLFRWDQAALRDRLQQAVARRHAHPLSVGVFDETSYVKKGDKTAGVQRQYCGAMGKRENCVVTVHLGYATPEFYSLLDGTLFLPEESWHADRDRCRAAGIPDEVIYRPKWQIVLEQYQRALGNGLRFAWLTFDEGYGGKPPFLRALDGFGQNYVAEIPAHTHLWTRRPEVLYKAHARANQPGRKKHYPRLKVKNNPRVAVRHILSYSHLMHQQRWVNYRVKDGTKGPMVWQVKRLLVWTADEQGLPTRPYPLLIARNALNHQEVKYFLSNAPETTPTPTLLQVAFSRWIIERAFEDSKTELGLDHFEVRKYQALQRHLLLTCVSHVFLSEFCLRWRGKKSRPDGGPGAHGDGRPDRTVGSRRPLFATVRRRDQRAIATNARAQRASRPEPSKTNFAAITRHRHQPENDHTMSLGKLIAL